MGEVFASQGAHLGTGVTGQKAVTTAGTSVQLSTSNTGIHTVILRAKIANTGKIYVGFSQTGVSSSLGLELGPGDAVTITTPRLSDIWLDCSVNGEGVSYLAT